MLKTIGVEKFKAFNQYTNIDIKPLTILCGVNSGGKSSVLKSLLLLKQSYESNTTANEALLNGVYTMNGSMRETIFKQEGNSFVIENTFIIKEISKYSKNSKQDIPSGKELKKIFNTRGGGQFNIINKIKFSTGHQNNIVSTNYISQYTMFIKYVNNKNNVENTQAKIEFLYKKGGKYDVEVENFPAITNDIVNLKMPECTCYFSGMKVNNLYCENLPKGNKLPSFLPNIYSVCRIIGAQYEGVKYLGPLRDFPERQYVVSRNTIGISTTGTDIPFILAKNKGRLLKGNTHPPKEENNYQYRVEKDEATFLEVVQYWMRYFELGDLTLVNENGVLTVKINDTNIADVGFGVSQILPIIVQAMALEYEQTILLEQPEIHLHPKMQMRMADLMLSIAQSNRNCIVETHSDHIINRIVRRALECKDDSIIKNVAIYFIENEGGKSVVKEIELDRVRGIAECPEAFFSQFASETGYIVQAGFNNMRRG